MAFDLMYILETIGLIAFAIAGAMTAIEKRLDYYGIMIAALATALGGGVLRDLLIGNIPPMALQDVSLSIITLASAYFTIKCYRWLNGYTGVIQFFDAIGLGVFTALGCRIAFDAGYESLFIAVCLGLATGTGGGTIRDALLREIPYVFQKEIYAVASIIGGIVFFFAAKWTNMIFASYLCGVVTFTIRMISVKLNLHLTIPKEIEEKRQRELSDVRQ